MIASARWPASPSEATNDLLRQFEQKGTDLSEVSQTWLSDIAWLLNDRPRKTLGWRTSAEAMADEKRCSIQPLHLKLESKE